MKVGQEIRRRREAKGWSQAKLAGLAAMGVSGVSQIETGVRNPSAVTLEKLAAALGVGVADLFPKAEAPLPFEENGTQQRRAQLTEALTSYLLRLAREWKDFLPGIEEVRGYPKVAFEVLSRNELVQAELLMLVELVDAITDNLHVEPGATDPKELVRAFFRVNDAAELWASSASTARDTVRYQTLRARPSSAWFETPEGRQWVESVRSQQAELESARPIVQAQLAEPEVEAERARAEEEFERADEKRRNAAPLIRSLHSVA